MNRFVVLVFSLFAAIALAQDWPQRPVKIVAPFAAASTPDTFARVLAEGLRRRFGQAVIVENKPGAGGMLGTDAVSKAAPDGYTIGLAGAGALGVNIGERVNTTASQNFRTSY